MALRAYHDSLQELEGTEDLLGEVASLLSDVADALSDHPHEIELSDMPRLRSLSVTSREWPTYARIAELIARWNEQRQRLERIWVDLSESERANLPSPARRGSTRLTPLV